MSRAKEETIEDYIANRTRREGECLLWLLGADTNHYPTGWFRGKIYKIGRFLWEKRNGPLPSGKMLLHSCDNLRCVEPSHLRAGTSKENRDDFLKRNPIASDLLRNCAIIAGKGSKRRWDSMTAEERSLFCAKRAQAQASKKAALSEEERALRREKRSASMKLAHARRKITR